MKKTMEKIEPIAVPLLYLFGALFFWELWISVLGLIAAIAGDTDVQYWLELSPFYHISQWMK